MPFQTVQNRGLRGNNFSLPSVSRTRPGYFDALGAAFRQENIIGSALYNGFPDDPFFVDEEFDENEYIPEDLRAFGSAFLSARNPDDVKRIAGDIRRELQDRDTLDQAGFKGFLAMMTAAVLDPINFIPVGGQLAKARTAGRLVRGAKTARAGFLGATLQESGLFATQETRTGTEVLANVAGSTIFAGMIGSAIRSVPLADLDVSAAKISREFKYDVDGAAPGQPKILMPEYIKGEELRPIIQEVKGDTAALTFDEALARGIINEGTAKIGKQMAAAHKDLDANTIVQIIDAERYATKQEILREGLDPDKPANILGSADSTVDPTTGEMKTIISLYKGADADTVVEEFYHRYWDRFSREDKKVFQKYHIGTGDKRTLREHFAQEGRDFLFSRNIHERSGTIQYLFEKAKERMLDLIARIKDIRGQNIPRQIDELYRRAAGAQQRYSDDLLARKRGAKRAGRKQAKEKAARSEKTAELMAEIKRITGEVWDRNYKPFAEQEVPRIRKALAGFDAIEDELAELTVRELIETENYNKTVDDLMDDLYIASGRIGDDLDDTGEAFQMVQREKIETKATKLYGTTDDPLDAAFIFPSGKFLNNLNERVKKRTGFPGSRDSNHPEIASKVLPDSGELNSVVEMTNAGFIRLRPELGSIQIGAKPTTQQLEAIEKFVSTRFIQRRGKIDVDFHDPTTGKTGSERIELPLSPEKIKRIINNFYEGGGERSTVQQFHTEGLDETGEAFQMVQRDVASKVESAIEQNTDIEGLAPFKGMPRKMSDMLQKWISYGHTGMRPLTSKYSKIPAKMAEWMGVTPEIMAKNLKDIGSQESVEMMKRRTLSLFKSRYDTAFDEGFYALNERLAGKKAKADPSEWEIAKAKLKYYKQGPNYRKEVSRAGLAIHMGDDVTGKYEPEVLKAAQKINKLYNELGKREMKAGLIPETKGVDLATGKGHFPIMYLRHNIIKYRNLVKHLLSKQGENEEIDKLLDSITGAPSEYENGLDLSGATNIDDIDKWTAKHFKKLTLAFKNLDPRTLMDVPITDADGVILKDKTGAALTMDFIESDPTRQFNQYIHNVLPSIILAEKNNGDITLKNMFKAMKDDYQKKRESLGIHADQKLMNKINKEEKNNMRDLKALRDMILGAYGKPVDPSVWSHRTSNALMTANTMLYLGSVMVSSIPDIARPIFHYGLRPYLNGIATYASHYNSPEFLKLRKEMREVWGASISAWNHERLYLQAGLSERATGLTKAEELLTGLQDKFGMVTGIDWWNATMKEISGVVATHAVLDVANQVRAGKAVKQSFLTQIAQMGLNKEDLIKISELVEARGEKYDALILPRTDLWGEENAALTSRFQSAMVKEIDQLILTPNIGDKPLWAHSGLGKHAFQFKSFAFNTMRSVGVQGLQKGDSELLYGLIMTTAMGGATYTIKQGLKGKPPTDDPAIFLMEAIDRGGLTGYLMDIDSMLQRASGGELGVQSALEGTTSRFQRRSDISAIAGPTAGTAENIVNLMGQVFPHILTGNMDKSDINTMYQLIPYHTAWQVQTLMEHGRNKLMDGIDDTVGTMQ